MESIMKRSIEESSVLKLKNEDTECEFTIEKYLDEGGSCVAYLVSYLESGDILHKGVLKEFCPAYLGENDAFAREGQKIEVPEKYRAQFETDLERFIQSYKAINGYLSENPSAANYHSVQIGLFSGNNTYYTLTARDYGESYDRVTDTDAVMLLKRILALSKAVEMYHNAGYLHLDIKSENVLVLDGVSDVIKLFDYDSLTPIELLDKRRDIRVPCPKSYYVPELEGANLRRIGIATDIYEIGATLFMRLFGRAPTKDEIEGYSKYKLDDLPILSGCTPRFKYELDEFFKHTLRISPVWRYSTDEELKAQLEKLIGLAGNKDPYLMNMPKWRPSARSVGRAEELKEIKRRLDADGYVFVQGIGGLGKSELAKLFADRYAEEYHTVQFIKYDGSLKVACASLCVDGVNNADYSDFEKLAATKNKILHLCDDHTLIVIDNFNVGFDEYLREFLPSGTNGFKVIFTTRCEQDADYYAPVTYKLPPLSDGDCARLFTLHCPGTSEEELPLLYKLIEKVDRNTLILKLMASAINKSGAKLEDMWNRLEAQKLEEFDEKIFHEYDYSKRESGAYNKLLSHLNAIFSISGLTPLDREILKNMSLVSPNGIGITEFIEYCGNRQITFGSLEELARESWIYRETGEIIAMHPIVSDLISWNESAPKEDSYYALSDKLREKCDPENITHFSVMMSRLSQALQLDRRYISEDADHRVGIKGIVGRLYYNIYHPAEAGEYLRESLKIAEEECEEYILPYVYYRLGELEKKFGTLTEAINWFRKSCDIAVREDIDYDWIALKSASQEGECYIENGNVEKGLECIDRAINICIAHDNVDDLIILVKKAVNLCEEACLRGERARYVRIYQRYFGYAKQAPRENGGEAEKNETEEDPSDLIDWNEIVSAVRLGDYELGERIFNGNLAEVREKYGEKSPQYKEVEFQRYHLLLVSNRTEEGMRLFARCLDFIASVYTENSMKMANELQTCANLLLMLGGDLDYIEDAVRRSIDICERMGEVHSLIYFNAKLDLVKLFFLKSELEKAEEIMSGIDFSEFDSADALENLFGSACFALIELSSYDEAEKIAKSVLKKSKAVSYETEFEAYVALSVISEQRGDLDLTGKWLEKASYLIPKISYSISNADYLTMYYRGLARLQFRKADFSKAAEILGGFLNDNLDLIRSPLALFTIYSELGLFRVRSGDFVGAFELFKKCEKMISSGEIPEKRGTLLWCNESAAFFEKDEIDKAEKCINKIVEINPAVLEPRSRFDAMICYNSGRLSHVRGDLKKAEDLYIKALSCFERIGSLRSFDVAYLLNFYAVLCGELKRYADGERLVRKAYDLYDRDFDPNGIIKCLLCINYTYFLLAENKNKQAYDHAISEENYFSNNFGTDSIIYLQLMTEVGKRFLDNDDPNCAEFLSNALDSAGKQAEKETEEIAKLKCLIGIYLLFFEGEYGDAIDLFKSSEELYEKLGLGESDDCRAVGKYLKRARDAQFDRAIKELADSITRNKKTEEENSDE